MTDENPEPTTPAEPNEILDELREMGKLLRDTLQTAWNSEERRKLTQDIEEGLGEVRSSLGEAFQEFKGSPAGQTLKTEVSDFQERVRTGEVESKARDEILNALRIVNTELRKVAKKDQ